jgi:hypothetical protein
MRALALVLALLAAAPAVSNPWREAAQALPALLLQHYAYPERLPAELPPQGPLWEKRAAATANSRDLTRFAEDMLLLLADHHAIVGRARPDSWALVPAFADLWIELAGARLVVTDVRAGSPAAHAGASEGWELIAVDSVPAATAARRFWADLGIEDPNAEQTAFAARVLAAGRRDRPRRLTFHTGTQAATFTLPTLYADAPGREPVGVSRSGESLVIRLNDSLGDPATIASFDAAMARVRPGQPVILDLTDTPSGGNSVVARAIMGWFTQTPRAYQVHRAIAEERATGIPRQWVEQVLPRPGRYHAGPLSVRVGRWTGSMGEGMAIGLAAWGVAVVGRPMAGLRGAIQDIPAGPQGFFVKLPTERLMAVDGTPREAFMPQPERLGQGD